MPEHDPGTRVFYDGACPLCRAEIDLYRKQDSAGALRLVDVSAPRPDLPAALDRERAMARFHILTRDGELLSGAAAFAEVWRQLPGWRWAWHLARLPGVLSLLELAYRGFLPMRPVMVRLFRLVRGRNRKRVDPRQPGLRNRS